MKTKENNGKPIADYALEMSNEYLLDWDIKTDQIETPPLFKKILKITQHDKWIHLKDFLEIIEKNERKNFQKKIEHLKNGTISHFIKIIKTNGYYGKYKWLSIIFKPIEWDSKQNPIRIIGLFTDITALKLSDQKHEREIKIKEVLIETSNDFCYCVDSDFKLVSANSNFLIDIKYHNNKKLKIGDNIKNILGHDNDFKKKWLLFFKKALEGNPGSFEHLAIYKSLNTQRWSELSFTPIFLNNKIISIAIRSKDINYKKKLENKIIEDKELFESMFMNHLSEMIIINPETLDIIDANESAVKFYGYPRDKFCTMKLTDISCVESSQIINRISKIKDLQKLSFISKHRTASGEIKTLEIKSSAIKENGRTVLFSIINDISEKVIAENLLKAEQQQLKLFEMAISRSKEVVMITEAEPINLPGPKIVYVNEAFTETTGYTAEEVIGKTPRILQGPKTDRSKLDELRNSMEKWEPCEIETINYKKNGEEFWIRFSIAPMKNENGWFTHWVSIQNDISKQKNDEEAILRERKLFRTVIDNLPDRIYVKDLKGRKMIANKKDLTFMGLKNESEAIGKTDFDIYPKDTAEKLSALDNFVLKTGKEIINFEEKLLNKNQKEQWLLKSKVPLRNDKNEIIGLVGIGRDITERHQMMEIISENEERIRNIMLSTSDSIWEIDKEGRIIYCNDKFEKILGYKPEEVIGKSLFDMLLPKEREIEINRYMYSVKNKLAITDLENKPIHKNGQDVWILTNAYPKLDKEGNLLGYIGIDKDITARKKAEEEISSSKRFFKLISELNDLVLNAKNEDEIYSNICRLIVETGQFLFAWLGKVNEKNNLIKPFIWSGKEDGYLQKLNEILINEPKDKGPASSAYLNGKCYYCNDVQNDSIMSPWREEALKRGFLSCIALPIKTEEKVTSVLAIYASKSFFFNTEEVGLLERVAENTSYALSTFSIAEKKRMAEIQLNKVLQAIHHSSAIIIITDKEGKAEYANPAFEKTTGYSLQEMKKNTQGLLSNSPNSIEKDYPLWEFIKKGNKWQGELINSKKNGKEYWEYVIISPVSDSNGDITNFVAIKEDISAWKLAEQNLVEANNSLKIKTEELTNSNYELERFAYVASHDLQEPLRMITNFLLLLEKKYNDQIDEKGKKYIHFAVSGANKMKELITDLLQYSRAGSGSLEIQDIDMNLIMKDIFLMLRNDIYHSKVKIIVEQLPTIKAGRTAMLQIMQNLIGNAIKFRSIEKPIVKVTARETNQEWIISVSDNGIGIDPEYLDKIFMMFQQLHHRDEYSGTGIGLSICKKIVERYNGKIWVSSELGNGSCFEFSIPKIQA